MGTGAAVHMGPFIFLERAIPMAQLRAPATYEPNISASKKRWSASLMDIRWDGQSTYTKDTFPGHLRSLQRGEVLI